MSIGTRDRTFREHISLLTTFFMAAFHVGAIAALFMFTWKGLAVAAVLWWVTGSLGIGMGYHRLLTHRGYKCPKWVEYFLTICGTLALEGGPMFWVATHRVHHQNSDQEGDPHSPRDGGFWSHMGWIITGRAIHNNSDANLPYVPDLRKDKFHTWITDPQVHKSTYQVGNHISGEDQGRKNRPRGVDHEEIGMDVAPGRATPADIELPVRFNDSLQSALIFFSESRVERRNIHNYG